ncbi:hypothetical protein Efla_004049 [Eimeria flavescens]
MATWDLRKKTLTVGAAERKNTINVEGWQTAPDKGPKDRGRQIRNKEDTIYADFARNDMEDDIQPMGRQEAKALVRPTPKHYKGNNPKHKRIPIEERLKTVTENLSQKINQEGARGENGSALTLVSAVGHGRDPADETHDSAAAKSAIFCHQDDARLA